MRTLDSPHTETVSALAWVPDGSGFVSGAQDRRIVLWSADGRVRDDWGHTPIRIFDLALTPDFSRLVAIGESANQPPVERDASLGARRDGSATPPERGGTPAERSVSYQIIVYDLATKTPELYVTYTLSSMPLSHRNLTSTATLENQLTSVSISADSRYALVNHAPDELLLWDLHAQRHVRTFAGQRQPRHVIRSCFGGVDEAFIVSGSEGTHSYRAHPMSANGTLTVWFRWPCICLAPRTGSTSCYARGTRTGQCQRGTVESGRAFHVRVGQ